MQDETNSKVKPCVVKRINENPNSRYGHSQEILEHFHIQRVQSIHVYGCKLLITLKLDFRFITYHNIDLNDTQRLNRQL